MREHERDALSLMGGVLLLLVGGLFLLEDLAAVDVDGRWIGPGVLIAVGLAGLAASLRSTGRQS